MVCSFRSRQVKQKICLLGRGVYRLFYGYRRNEKEKFYIHSINRIMK